MEANIVDWLTIYSCIGRFKNPIPERITADAPRYNTKQNFTMWNMKTLLYPSDYTVNMDSVDRRHQRQNSKNSQFATIQVSI